MNRHVLSEVKDLLLSGALHFVTATCLVTCNYIDACTIVATRSNHLEAAWSLQAHFEQIAASN